MAIPFRVLRQAFLAGKSTRVSQVRNSVVYRPDRDFKPPHLDEMPVPSGSWQAHYRSKNKAYNLQLLVGIVSFVSTVAFIVNCDRIFFNFYPPPLPDSDALCTFEPPPQCD